MFTVIDDTIHWDGQPVAVFRRDVCATVRERVETALDIESGENMSIDSPEDDLAAITEERDALLAQRDAYAAILGVEP